MSASDEMIEICLETDPDIVTLVPEGREELTTEGGLNMSAVYDDFESRVYPALGYNDITISLFLDPNPKDIELAHKLGTDAVELHTGTYANAINHSDRLKELKRLQKAAQMIHEAGMTVNAGHGLNLENLPLLIEHVPHLGEISIGHALVSKAVFLGLENTVKEYLNIINL